VQRHILVLNGPNLNLLGDREKSIYGSKLLADVADNCIELGKELGLTVKFEQSNYEGEIIDYIHAARGVADGIIINPAAYTHTSIAILDALNAFEGLVYELHISNIHKREEFRHHSYVSLRADCVMAGLGVQGYEIAVQSMADSLSGAKLDV